MKKSDFRKKFLEQRKQISIEQRESSGVSAAHVLQSSTLFKSSNDVACYFAIGNEFNCSHIIQSIWAAEKNCYLPLLTQDKKLSFSVYDKNTALHLNQYQIYEPKMPSFFSAEKLDLVLIPLVGFDEKGNRLGRGGGFYDKTFAFKQAGEKPFLLGVGFEQQKAEELPNDVWDVKLDGVLTEHRLIIFNMQSLK